MNIKCCRHVYWVDSYLNYIERCDYNGDNRRTIVRGSPAAHLYTLAVFQTNIFVTSWRENAVLKLEKHQPNKVTK